MEPKRDDQVVLRGEVMLSDEERKLVRITHLVYALHTLSLLMGIFTTVAIVTAFVFGWPSIIAVIINYVKRSQVRGTWLDSHFSWQIRTFWWTVLWIVVGAILILLLVGIVLTPVLIFGVGLWVVYRIARGWMALVDRRSIPGGS